MIETTHTTRRILRAVAAELDGVAEGLTSGADRHAAADLLTGHAGILRRLGDAIASGAALDRIERETVIGGAE